MGTPFLPLRVYNCTQLRRSLNKYYQSSYRKNLSLTTSNVLLTQETFHGNVPSCRVTDTVRAVAQGFSVHVWGTWGRRFKSAQPDIINYPVRINFLQDFFWTQYRIL